MRHEILPALLPWILCLPIISCASRRDLTEAEGPLAYKITGRFTGFADRGKGTGALENVEVNIDHDGKYYLGTISRSVIHTSGKYVSKNRYDGQMYGALHSRNEIIFRDKLLLSCKTFLKQGIQKEIQDLRDVDFESPVCKSPAERRAYDEREELTEVGALYFFVASNSEIWWHPGPNNPATKLKRVSEKPDLSLIPNNAAGSLRNGSPE